MKSDPASYRTIDPAEAERLVREGAVRVLDVRTPEEFERLGHVPGAILLPVDLIPVAAATLERDGKPLLVCCEHGIRSQFAARFLAQAGFAGVMNLGGGMSCWTGKRDHGPGDPHGETGPSSWLVLNADLLPQGGRALDLACGTGRHALLLAAAGFRVTAVDRDAARIETLAATASRLGLPICASAVDLEAPDADLGAGRYDLIVVVHYLHRPLFPALKLALAPGGILLYETFNVDQALRGRPRRPEFLLKKGELRRLVAPLAILREREGEHEGRMVSGVVARKEIAS